MLTAEELHERGVGASGAGHFALARRLFEKALARTSDEALTGGIEASLAYVEAETGRRDEAMRLCEQALTRPGLTPLTVGTIHSQLALLLMLAGRSPESLEEYRVAIGMLQGHPKQLGRAHGNRGTIHIQNHAIEEAEADFLAATRLLKEAGLADEAAMDEHNLGCVRLLAGDLVGALDAMDRARVVLAPMGPVAQATCDTDRAEVLMAAGLVSEARAALLAAARAYGARKLRRLQAEAELLAARTLLLEDPSRARDWARGAARRFRQSDLAPQYARAQVVTMAATVELGRSAPSLLRASTELVAELERQGLRWQAANLRLHTARMRLRGGRAEEARATLAELHLPRRTPLDLRLLARDVRAEVAAARGGRTRALGHLRRGLGELHDWQSSFGSLDLQTNVVGQGVRLAQRGLELAISSPSDTVLFEWSERARMLASRVQPVRPPADPQLTTDLTELRGSPSPAREAELRRRIRERAWQQRGSGQVADPLTLLDLQTVLGAERALVAYVVAAGRVVALVVTEERAARVELGAREPLDTLLGGLLPDLDVAATDLSGPLAAAVRGELVARLGRLADVLVTPLLPYLGDRAAVLTPSGVLAGVPWSLVPGLVGRPVTVAQSATSWLARSATPLRTAGAAFVAGPRVVRAEAEVEAAAKEWDGATVLCGRDATSAAVSELAAGVDVLHIAAHGRHSSESPLFSGLQLVDGPWFGYDVDQLAAVPDVVLLSACEVGRSTVRWGEELIGMTAAWLHAGARCVIASPAAVADVAAYDAFVRLHRGLVSGLAPAEALAAAVPAPGVDEPPAPFVCFS